MRRIKNREERKAEKEKNLLSLKQSALPVFEPRTRIQSSKCSSCNKRRENYDIKFEWILEPIDVLKENQKGFLSRYGTTRKLLSCIMKALVVEPVQIKIIKFLQELKPNIPVVLVIKSNNLELDQCLIKFIFETFHLKIPSIVLNENSIKEALNAGDDILISDESHLQAVYDVSASKEIYWLPISVAYEVRDSTPFSFTPYDILRKMRAGYGLVKVVFHEPYEQDDFFQRRDPSEEFIRKHLYHDIVFKAPVMAPDVIAFLLLTYFNKGAKIEEMSAKVDEIRKEMCTIDFAFEGTAIDVVEYSLDILKGYITIDNEGIITPKGDKIEELKDYARVLLYHHAFKSAILSSAMYLKSIDPLQSSSGNSASIYYQKMMNYATDMCDVLSEIIPFRVCASIHDQLIDAFNNLTVDDLLRKRTIVYTENQLRAQKIAKYFDDDDDDNSYDDDSEPEEEEDMDPNNQVIINIDKQKEIDVLKDIILLIQGNDMAEGDREIQY